MSQARIELGQSHGEVFALRNPDLQLGREFLDKLVASVYEAQPPIDSELLTSRSFISGVFKSAIENNTGASV